MSLASIRSHSRSTRSVSRSIRSSSSMTSSPHSSARDHPAALRRLTVCAAVAAVALAVLAAPAGAAKKPKPAPTIGDTIKWKGGTATLHDYVVNDPQAAIDSVLTKLKPGERWDSADVEVCRRGKKGASSLTGNFDVHPLLFHAETTDRRRYDGDVAHKPLALGQLGPNECLRGWMGFVVPTDAKVTAVLYAGGDLSNMATIARWQIPAA